jgi:hypothetical protein
MLALEPSKEILRGSILGETHAADFARRVASLNLSGDLTILLDFGGIEAATASYLKQFFSPLLGRDESERVPCTVFPLATSVSDDLLDDLHSFLNDKGWMVIEVEKSGNGTSFVRLLGSPESATEKTFSLLREARQASAGSLFEASEDKSITQTAWNNRLTNLLKLRLATRRKLGRNWIYQTTF